MKEIQRTFEQYAKAGASHDVMDALRLLTEAYVMECGVSLGNRTAVFYAAEVWQEKLAWLDLELSEIAREANLTDLMPLLSDSYAPECNEYDITGMKADELIECCKGIINDREFNEATLEVLCHGIHEYATKPKFEPYDIEENPWYDVQLKGRVLSQGCGETIVEMTKPYKNICAVRHSLVREPEGMLVDAYIDYTHMLIHEKVYRDLYEQYKTEYFKCDRKSTFEKTSLFDKIYGDLLRDCIISNSEQVLSKLYGLEFYDSYNHKDPSWYTKNEKESIH